MIAALGAALLDIGLDVVKYAVAHPDIAAKLIRDAGAAVSGGGGSKPHPDAVAAQVAGLAAARAVAAQQYGRMLAKKKL